MKTSLNHIALVISNTNIKITIRADGFISVCFSVIHYETDGKQSVKTELMDARIKGVNLNNFDVTDKQDRIIIEFYGIKDGESYAYTIRKGDPRNILMSFCTKIKLDAEAINNVY